MADNQEQNAPAEEVQDVAQDIVDEETIVGGEVGSLLEDSAEAQKLYGYVKEVVDLFQPRVESGELTQMQVAEILALSLTGSVYGTLPQKQYQLATKESDSLVNYLWKQYMGKVKKKNLLFGSQVLAATRFASYIVSHANETIKSITAQRTAAAAQAQASLDEVAGEDLSK